MMRKALVVSLGAKDSTAMLEHLLRTGQNVVAAVALDTGWEFPELLEHWRLVEAKTGVQVTRLRPEVPFNWIFSEWPTRASRDYPEKHVKKGQVWRWGKGWPSWSRRWCTNQKARTLDRFIAKHYPDAVQCIGFAANEKHRMNTASQKRMQQAGKVRYPLIEAGITEQIGLAMCYEYGYRFGGLYEVFDRLSCWCCPLQTKGSLCALYHHRPELWAKIRDMDARRPEHNPGFRGKQSILSIENEIKAKKDSQ